MKRDYGQNTKAKFPPALRQAHPFCRLAAPARRILLLHPNADQPVSRSAVSAHHRHSRCRTATRGQDDDNRHQAFGKRGEKSAGHDRGQKQHIEGQLCHRCLFPMGAGHLCPENAVGEPYQRDKRLPACRNGHIHRSDEPVSLPCLRLHIGEQDTQPHRPARCRQPRSTADVLAGQRYQQRGDGRCSRRSAVSATW